MVLRWLLMLLAFLPICSVQAGMWDEFKSKIGLKEKAMPPSIRILLAHDLEGVHLEVKGMYSLYDPYSNSHLSTRFIGKSRYIQAVGDGLKWGEAFPGLYQLQIKPEEETTVTWIEGKPYAGSSYIYDIGGTISVVNQLSIENYIRLLPYQADYGSLHPEVLAAIAIVARTNAYYQASNPRNTYWAVDAQKVGYEGLKQEPAPIDQAINATRYMIMSRTGVYEGLATPFAAEFEGVPSIGKGKEVENSKISLQEANEMAQRGEHAAQIIGRAFPGTTIMMMQYAN